MSVLLHQLSLSAPLFILVFAGYGLMRLAHWPRTVGEALSRFVFSVALPPVDVRLLVAFFGGCLMVFVIGRVVAWRLFGLDGVAQSVFALGGVFSNNVMLGLPLARLMLGEEAVPVVALVLVFNALILWSLVTVSVEWARHGRFSLQGIARTARGVLTNPLICAILGGTLWGSAGGGLPQVLDTTLGMIADTAAPLALIALGMGLAHYRVGEGLALAGAISVLKLAVQPLAVWLLARALDLPELETRVVVLLASIGVGVNVHLMARRFGVIEAAVAASLVLSTLASALTTPLAIALSAP